MVTSTRLRIRPWSQRLLHQTIAPSPTTVVSGKHVRNILSGSPKDGADPATMVSILRNVVDHETVIVGESVRCPAFEGGRRGNEGVTNFGTPCKVYPGSFKGLEETARFRPIGRPRYVGCFPSPFISPDRVFWPDLGTKQVGDGREPLPTKEKTHCAGNSSGYDE